MKNPHDIIIRPVLTEKSFDGIYDKRYVFVVHPDANRTEVRQAVETIFGVRVAKVNISNQIGKMRRQGITRGRRTGMKKAYVSLTSLSKPIEFFEGMAQ